MNARTPVPLIDRPWLASYPAGVPAEVDWHACPSLKVLFERSCKRFADQPAFTSMGVTLSYAEADALSRHFAIWLQQQGLAKGDRIAVMLPNTLQHPVVVFGALRAGLAVVNVNPLYTAPELLHQLTDSGAVAIVVLENFAGTVEKALEGTAVRRIVVTEFGDLFPAPRRWLVNTALKRIRHAVPPWNLPGAIHLRDALAAGRAGGQLREADVLPEDIAFVQYTGGTTGRPKGAMLTHANLVANVEQVTVWTAGLLREGVETVITALPLYHVFALTGNLLVFVRLGGHNVLIPDPRDLRRFIGVLKRTRFSVITGVNTLFDALLNAPGFDEVASVNRGHLKLAVAGGMALQPKVSDRWQASMGRPIVQGYGLTETSPMVCANPIDAVDCSGKLGLPVPSTDVAILDDDGRPLPIGSTGEIGVRGPQVMAGYWKAPQETARVIRADGWLLTGDIGRMDERGYVEFIDRKKDLIVVSGMKAFPAEIEDAMRTHPGVKDAAAVGVPDAHSGEAVVLFVIRDDPGLDEAALLRHAEANLAPYKRPRRIVFRTELPRTPIGKVLRRQLKDEAAREPAP